ncbi:MAG TPA: hypothetical protein VNN77_16680 [candidate division Zixibacteria bacterium]|nr:hypothetical protein [candidate division Zixibacteria bacterium]
MDKSLERMLEALLQKEGLEPRDGDLERFGSLLEHYVATLETLRSVDAGDAEIAGVFHPERK